LSFWERAAAEESSFAFFSYRLILRPVKQDSGRQGRLNPFYPIVI